MTINIFQNNLVLHTGDVVKIIQHKTYAHQCTIQLRNFLEFNLPISPKKQFYLIGDQIDVVLSKDGHLIYAVHNKTQSSLWLNKHLVEFDPKFLQSISIKSLFLLFGTYFFLISIILLRQLLIDFDIFWGDLWDGLLFFHIPILLGVGYFFATNYQENKDTPAAQVYSLLKLPVLTSFHLKNLNMRNSYFEIEESLFNIRPVSELLKQHTKDKAEEIFNHEISQKDEFGLCGYERRYLKLTKHEGLLQNIKLRKIPKSEIDTDPYIEIKTKVGEHPIYGYVDEFNLTKNEKVTVICSSFSDHLGYYFWLMTDRKNIVYLDESQPYIDELEYYVKFYIVSFVIGLIAVFAFFIALGSDNFWGDLIVTLCTGCYAVLVIFALVMGYLKLFTENKSKNINAYILSQLNNLIMFPQLSCLTDLKKSVLYNDNRKANSRTAYRLDVKKGK